MWPGFSENLHVIDWALRRCDGEDIAVETPLGYVPKSGSLNQPSSLNLEGLSNSKVDEDGLFKLNKIELEDVAETEAYFEEQLPSQLPAVLQQELEKLNEHICNM